MAPISTENLIIFSFIERIIFVVFTAKVGFYVGVSKIANEKKLMEENIYKSLSLSADLRPQYMRLAPRTVIEAYHKTKLDIF